MQHPGLSRFRKRRHNCTGLTEHARCYYHAYFRFLQPIAIVMNKNFFPSLSYCDSDLSQIIRILSVHEIQTRKRSSVFSTNQHISSPLYLWERHGGHMYVEQEGWDWLNDKFTGRLSPRHSYWMTGSFCAKVGCTMCLPKRYLSAPSAAFLQHNIVWSSGHLSRSLPRKSNRCCWSQKWISDNYEYWIFESSNERLTIEFIFGI